MGGHTLSISLSDTASVAHSPFGGLHIYVTEATLPDGKLDDLIQVKHKYAGSDL